MAATTGYRNLGISSLHGSYHNIVATTDVLAATKMEKSSRIMPTYKWMVRRLLSSLIF